MNTIETMALGLGLVAFEFTRSLPAWWRVRSTGSASGVSVTSLGILSGTGVGWLGLTLLAGQRGILAGTLVWFVLHLALCVEVLRVDPLGARRFWTSASLAGGAIALTTAAFGVVGSAADGLGVALGFSTAAYMLPALLSGMLARSTCGLSVVNLLVTTLGGAIYLAIGYGVEVPSGQAGPTIGFLLHGWFTVICSLPRLVRTGARRVNGVDDESERHGEKAGYGAVALVGGR